MNGELHAVTGAMGYSGRAITAVLLGRGTRVRSLTGHPDRADPFGGRVEVVPLRFDDPGALRESLRGVRVLYNTYWVRFDHGRSTFAAAVERSAALFAAARAAGVERIVHVSITNPSLESDLPYFAGKARVEQALATSGVPHTVLRPVVFFGGADVLINNIAWLLRRLPVFGVVRGDYGIQPIHVDDLARLAVAAAGERGDVTRDAVGPETFRFVDLVGVVRRAVASRAVVMPVPAWLLGASARLLNPLIGDVVLTGDEVRGLTRGLLVSQQPPTGTTAFTPWLAAHAHELGQRWANELARHYR